MCLIQSFGWMTYIYAASKHPPSDQCVTNSVVNSCPIKQTYWLLKKKHAEVMPHSCCSLRALASGKLFMRWLLYLYHINSYETVADYSFTLHVMEY